MTDAPEPDAFTERLAAVQAGSRQRLPMLVGSGIAPLGLVLIGLAWLGASNTPVLQEQIAYLISGGLTGIALVVSGGFLYFSHWQTQQIRETRSQTQQVVAALAAVQSRLDEVVAGLAGQTSATLVSTPSGSLSHLRECSVVRGRQDLVPVRPGAAVQACRMCQPT